MSFRNDTSDFLRSIDNIHSLDSPKHTLSHTFPRVAFLFVVAFPPVFDVLSLLFALILPAFFLFPVFYVPLLMPYLFSLLFPFFFFLGFIIFSPVSLTDSVFSIFFLYINYFLIGVNFFPAIAIALPFLVLALQCVL